MIMHMHLLANIATTYSISVLSTGFLILIPKFGLPLQHCSIVGTGFFSESWGQTDQETCWMDLEMKSSLLEDEIWISNFGKD